MGLVAGGSGVDGGVGSEVCCRVRTTSGALSLSIAPCSFGCGAAAGASVERGFDGAGFTGSITVAISRSTSLRSRL